MEEFLFFMVVHTLRNGLFLRMLPNSARIHAYRNVEDAYSEFKEIERIILNEDEYYKSYIQVLTETTPIIIKIPNNPKLIRELIGNGDINPIQLDSIIYSEITFDFPVIKVSDEVMLYKEFDIGNHILEMVLRK